MAYNSFSNGFLRTGSLIVHSRGPMKAFVSVALA